MQLSEMETLGMFYKLMTANCWESVCNLTKIIAIKYFLLYTDNIFGIKNNRCSDKIIAEKGGYPTGKT